MDKTAKAIYISQQDESIDIQVDDNRGLLHYIEKFHEIITKEIDTLYQDYKIIDTPNRNKKKDENISKKEAKKRILKFYDNCYNLIGLGVFVQSLLNCIQNKVCRLDNSGSQLPEHAKKKYQSYASNMVNAKAGVEALRSKIKHHHDDENLRKANNISHISLFLGIISIVLAIFSFEAVRTPVYKMIHNEGIISDTYDHVNKDTSNLETGKKDNVTKQSSKNNKSKGLIQNSNHPNQIEYGK